jgi:hypothetical protein
VNAHEIERRQKRVGYFVKLCEEFGLLGLAEEMRLILGDESKLNVFYIIFRKWIV